MAFIPTLIPLLTNHALRREWSSPVFSLSPPLNPVSLAQYLLRPLLEGLDHHAGHLRRRGLAQSTVYRACELGFDEEANLCAWMSRICLGVAILGLGVRG